MATATFTQIASTTLNSAAVAAIFTGSLASGVLSVTAVSSGTLYPGQTITGSTVNAGTVITTYGGDTVLSNSIVTAGTGYAINDIVTAIGGNMLANKDIWNQFENWVKQNGGTMIRGAARESISGCGS